MKLAGRNLWDGCDFRKDCGLEKLDVKIAALEIAFALSNH
jgi:hypothetical protein